MSYTKDDIRRINDASEGRLLDVVQDFHELRRSGRDYVCDCPHCGATRKFSVSPAKGIFKCFSCNQVAGKGAIAYLMNVEGKGYMDALDYLAHKFNVILDVKPKNL